MPPRNDIFQTSDLKWGIGYKPCDDIVAKVDYIEQTDEGLKIHCKVEKENNMNKNEELKNVDTIIITRDGDTVSLCAYDESSGVGRPVVCHKTTAKCGPNDIFDFNIGAKLAFDRLYEGYDMTPKPKRKPYNGKIFVEKYPGNALKSHKIYQVRNGCIQPAVVHRAPYIFEDMNDAEMSWAIHTEIYDRHAILGVLTSTMTRAYFVKE